MELAKVFVNGHMEYVAIWFNARYDDVRETENDPDLRIKREDMNELVVQYLAGPPGPAGAIGAADNQHIHHLVPGTSSTGEPHWRR